MLLMEDGMLRVKEVAYGSSEYLAAVALRQEVLRKPLGLAFSQEQLAAERGDRHVVCTQGGHLAGCLLLTDIGDGRVKMRQVAVRADRQGKGIGSALVTFGETLARDSGFCEVVLHARETAVGFYERLGYTRMGTRFVQVTLPHWEMVKKLDLP